MSSEIIYIKDLHAYYDMKDVVHVEPDLVYFVKSGFLYVMFSTLRPIETLQESILIKFLNCF